MLLLFLKHPWPKYLQTDDSENKKGHPNKEVAF